MKPNDRTHLPDRRASLLRATQQLNQYDDRSFIDIKEEQETVMKKRVQKLQLSKMSGQIIR